MEEKDEKKNKRLKVFKALKLCCATFVSVAVLSIPVSLGLILGGSAKSEKAVNASNYNEANEAYKKEQYSNLHNQYTSGELTLSEYETAVQNVDDLSKYTYMTKYEDVSEELKNSYITGQNMMTASIITSSVLVIPTLTGFAAYKVCNDDEILKYKDSQKESKGNKNLNKKSAEKVIEI